MKEIIETGRTVEEAIKKGRQAIGNEDALFEIIETPRKGFLGLKMYPAKVRVYMEEGKDQMAITYLHGVLDAMGAHNFNITEKMVGENLSLTLEGDDLGFIIGRRGETLDALQYITSLVVNRMEGDYMRVTIDSGNFRENREKTLEGLARRLARNTVKTGRSVTLEAMNPYERRIIHATVSTVEGAGSSSIGEEPNRRVVIHATNPKRPERKASAPRPATERTPLRPNTNRPEGEKATFRPNTNKPLDKREARPPMRENTNKPMPPRTERGPKAPSYNAVPRREDTAPKTVRTEAPQDSKIPAPLYGKIEI